MRTPLFMGLGLLLAVTAHAQDTTLKARELFYTPITDTKPAAAPTKETTAPKTAAAKPSKPKPSNTKEGVPTSQASKSNTATPDGTRVQNATNRPDEVVGPPLALKYRILKRTEEGRYDEVDTDTVFRSGDKIRVSVESNDNGYLYIVQQGSSKTWNLLFPNSEIDSGSNHIQRNREYDLPGGGRFTFDEQPGVERLFVILTRKPEPDLEKLIYSLQGTPSKPASGSKPEEPSKMILAQNRIDGAVIDRLRGTVLARDLVFEKVNDDGPVSTSSGKRKEKAMYVASQDRTSGARVVVDMALKHQ